MDATRRFLTSLNLPPEDLHTLPGAAQYRVEIPRTRGPAAVLEQVSLAWSHERVRQAGIGRDLLAHVYPGQSLPGVRRPALLAVNEQEGEMCENR